MGLLCVSKKEARLGRGFLIPVCSRYSFLRTISSLSAVSRKRAVFSSVSMVTALPLTLVMQSTGFLSCGTHLAVPPRLCRESLMTQTSKAARFSAPEYCSLVRLSYMDFASVTAARFTWSESSVETMAVILNSRLRRSRFLRS